MIGRLKPGVGITTAQADFARIANALGRQYPENAGHGVWAMPLKQSLVGEFSGYIYVLMGAVGFVLLIVCANVANLLLARATSRETEIGMRSALGASRARIVRQMLTESILLALAGGLGGLLLALASTSALAKSAAQILPRAEQIGVDGRVLLFTLAAAVLTGIVFGLVPALRSSRSPNRDAGRSIVAGRSLFRDSLVVTQVALTLPLLAGGALMVRSLWNLRGVDPGFDPRNVVVANVALSAPAASSGSAVRRAITGLVRRLSAIPGVESVALIENLPMSGEDAAAPIWPADRPPPQDPNQMPVALLYSTTPRYLDVMKIPILRGRFIDEHDGETSHPVVVIDEDTARALFPGQDPIGKRISIGPGAPLEVVGLAGHVKHFGLDDAATTRFHLQLYYPVLQLPDPFLKGDGSETFVIRAKSDPASVAANLRAAVHSVDADDAVSNVRWMDDMVSETLSYRKFLLGLLATFAGVALILAAVGIYGVISYSVSRRTREIGIRMALGAARSDILRSIVGQAAILALGGIAFGIGASILLTRFLKSVLFGVGATDPLTFAGVAIALALVALAASFIPALRGARSDPLASLRCE